MQIHGMKRQSLGMLLLTGLWLREHSWASSEALRQVRASWGCPLPARERPLSGKSESKPGGLLLTTMKRHSLCPYWAQQRAGTW